MRKMHKASSQNQSAKKDTSCSFVRHLMFFLHMAMMMCTRRQHDDAFTESRTNDFSITCLERNNCFPNNLNNQSSTRVINFHEFLERISIIKLEMFMTLFNFRLGLLLVWGMASQRSTHHSSKLLWLPR